MISLLAVLSAALVTGGRLSTAHGVLKPAASAPLQWEYLIVSFGKMYFTGAAVDPEQKEAGVSKLLAFSSAGLISAKEAINTQKQMDALGRYGWELVGVVGVIGGDQELLFKRQFEKERSEREAALIAAEAKAIEEALKRVEAAKPQNDELIDLDQTDLEGRRNGIRQKLESRLRDALSALAFPRVKLVNVRVELELNGAGGSTWLHANCVLDATDELLTGNTYRTSQAQGLAQRIHTALAKSEGFKIEPGGFDSLRVSLVITHNGKQHDVAKQFELGLFQTFRSTIK